MNCLTLFSGGGLADCGLKAAGYVPIGAVEWDAEIAAVYAANHGSGHLKVAGVETVDYRPFAGIDLAWVSPCCTNASVANSDGKEGPEDWSAADAICRMLREARPLRFVLENVYGYRNFRCFQLILKTLVEQGYAFVYEHVNFADYGVPQTRKRLILRAVLGAKSVPPLCPTHCEGGDAGGLFAEEALSPWVGWYAAIEDLIPTLPESQFADWQLARLRDTPIGDWMVGGGNTNKEIVTSRPRLGRLPSFTVTASSDRDRAFLVEGKPANYDGELAVSHWARPAPTVTASETRHPKRALLVDGDGNRSRDPTIIEGQDPSMTVQAWHGRRPIQMPRAWLEQGRVVAMTPRALARFQSVPDAYQLPEAKKLACKIIGNGVPSLGAQRIAESFQR